MPGIAAASRAASPVPWESRVPLHERHDIGRAQALKRRPRLTALLGEKLTEESKVGLHGRRHEPALSPQILPKSILELRLGRLVHHRWRGDDHPVRAEVCKQVTEGGPAAPPLKTRRGAKKRCYGALVEIRQRDPVASHPPIERPNQWQLRSSRLSCISQRDEMLRERIQMWPQWAGARATYYRGVAVICHFFSFPARKPN